MVTVTIWKSGTAHVFRPRNGRMHKAPGDTFLYHTPVPRLDPDRIALRLPRVAVVHLEQPLAPRIERIVGLEEPRRRHRARPLQGAEQDVVGEARPVAGNERVLHQ